jgi:hypothetical protein
MITYKVEDTEFQNVKNATIYPTEDIEDLFLDISIYNPGTVNLSTSITIQVPEKFIRQLSEKTGIEILDLIVQGIALDYKKYLSLRLDKNITLIHAQLK